MSDTQNSELIERAGEVKDYFEGTDLETAIDRCIASGDLDMLAHLVQEAESEIARQEFYNNDMMKERDEY